MAEPFKNLFNPSMISQMAEHIAKHSREFDQKGFVQQACNGLDALELKARSNQIRDALIASLPDDFQQCCDILTAALHPDDSAPLGELAMDAQGIRGWAIMPMADVIAVRGIQHFDIAMPTLAAMTCRLSAEFAVRPFFIADASRALQWAMRWASSNNEHIRRLASEGSRTRLPWGLRLQQFVDNPMPLMPVLEALKDDPSEYVRRSVANSINDIAKDHPERVAKLAAEWLEKASPERRRLVKHACRGLVKQGHQPTLAALGYGEPRININKFSLSRRRVTVGESVAIEVAIQSTSNKAQPLIIDYAIHHMKANGKTTPKVFKWKTIELPAVKTVTLNKRHSMQAVTTRRYYPGTHKVELLVNGQSQGLQTFELLLNE